MNMSPALSKAP